MTADPPPSVEVVVVRPARLPPSPADPAFSTIKVTPEAIATSPRLDVALSDVPGVTLFRRTSSLGANPTTQGVSIRGIAGSGASRALVTLDGVPQNDPFGGWVIWTRLPPEIIGGATVVRGAGAGPYGAGALTGTIALEEASPAPGSWALAAAGGSLGQARGSATASVAAAGGTLFLAAAGEHSDGWIPVREGRGAADTHLTLDDEVLSARFQTDLGPAVGSLRASAWQEERGSGLVGAKARERGAAISATAARDPTASEAGWRAQLWTQVSDLANTAVAVAPGRSSTSVTNDQYQTPAIGYGANVAARWLPGAASLEIGLDARGAAGEERERFHPVNSVLTYDRHAGGQTLTGGLYGEATMRSGPWLLVAGARVDGWSVFDSHRVEHDLTTGATRLDLRPAARDGVLPSARLAARVDPTGAFHLRAAAYSGLRAPTLNELYRPFRVGNDITEANPDLVPERLYGVEAGVGGSLGRVRWNATGFYNRLDKAITNVTVGVGPFLDPVAGFVPPGGTLRQRQNAGAIDADGVEADAEADLTSAVSARAALSWTIARVDGGAAAPQLTGLRPAETPRLSVTWDMDWRVVAPFTVTGRLRYDSARFDDDQNLRRLAPATTIDVRAQWRVARTAIVFVAIDNLFDVAVATGTTGGGVTSYGPPLTVSVGVRLTSPG